MKAAYLWSLTSKVCRERDDYTCLKCGKSYRHEPGGVDASHHIGRRKGIVKYDLENLATLCRACHTWLDTHPLHHADWIKELLGEERYDALKERSVGYLKMTEKDKKELAAYMRETLKDLQRRRAEGEIGRLVIDAPGTD